MSGPLTPDPGQVSRKAENGLEVAELELNEPTPVEPPTMDEWRALGARLKAIREYLNLSQQDVAGRTGVPRSAISDIERGNRKVDSLELRRFARLYQLPVGYLLGEHGDASEQVLPAALARAVTQLTDQDRSEITRYAEFLRFRAGHDASSDQD